MRPWWALLLIPLLLAALASGSGEPSLRHDDGAAEAVAAAAVGERREHHGGGGQHHDAAAAREAFYLKVGRFAVMVHSMWNGIRPVPRLERVVSASTRPAEGGGVDYLLVLRVASPLGTCRVLVWGVSGEGSEAWKLKRLEPVSRA